MSVEMRKITRLIMDPTTRVYRPVEFEVTVDLAKLDAAVFYKAVRQVRGTSGMNGVVRVVKLDKLVGTKP